MILTHFAYGKITITYDEPVDDFDFRNQVMGSKEEEVWRDAQIFFENNDGHPRLRIAKGDKGMLLARAEVLELTPWSAKFVAYWWKGHDIKYNKDGSRSKRQPAGFARLVRAEVACEF